MCGWNLTKEKQYIWWRNILFFRFIEINKNTTYLANRLMNFFLCSVCWGYSFHMTYGTNMWVSLVSYWNLTEGGFGKWLVTKTPHWDEAAVFIVQQFSEDSGKGLHFGEMMTEFLWIQGQKRALVLSQCKLKNFFLCWYTSILWSLRPCCLLLQFSPAHQSRVKLVSADFKEQTSFFKFFIWM